MQETQKSTLSHINQIERYTLSEYLQIDAASFRNLELARTIREGRKTGSLLGVIDQTITSMGGRMLRTWLEKPLLSVEKIKQRQACIDFMYRNTMVRMELAELLKEIQDLERLTSRLVYGSGSARDLVALKTSLAQVPRIKALLGKEQSVLAAYGEQLDELAELTELISRAIVDNPPITVRDGGLIKPGYNTELDELRQINKDGKFDCRSKPQSGSGPIVFESWAHKVFATTLK